MFTDRQTTPSKGLPGTPPSTEHTYAVPIFNPFIPLAPTISPLSSTQEIRLTLSPSHSSVVAKTITSEIRGDSPSPPPITKHTRRKSEPTIRTSHYLISQTRSFFSPQPNIGAANTTVVDPIQHWVNHSTPTPPPQVSPPHTPTQQHAPQPTTTNTNTTTTKQKRSIPPIIIDNITIPHTQSETFAQLHKQFHNIEITKTQFLVRGGLALTPRNPKDANTILSREKWDLAFFGPHIYIHIAHKDQRPWYCINRIPLDMHDSLIRTALENHRTPSGHSIDPEGIHRNTKGPLPTTLYIFKVKDSTTGKSITDTDITIDGKQYRIRKFIQSGILRCTKCQGFGHLWKGCNKPKKCVRCSGPNCEVGDCKKTLRKCANCGGDHSAAMKTCPERKK